MRTLILIAAAVLVSTPAAAKSKAEVAANCMSQRAAGAVYGAGGLRYRIVDGRQCWYHPAKAVAKAKPRPVRVAALTQKAAPPPKVTPVPTPSPAPPVIADDLERVQRAMCGGSCPRFDLDNGDDRATYRALCGGPCPDFRTPVFDDVFRAFGLAPRVP